MLNRKEPPQFVKITNVALPKIEQTQLDNGIPVYITKGGTQEVVGIDLIFDAGTYQQPALLVASATNNMRTEGTTSLTAAQIAEKIEFYGAHLNSDTNFHYSALSLFTVRRHLPHTLAVMCDVVKNPTFPEKEFGIYIQKRKQNYLIELSKVEVQASYKFTESLWGQKHPYGVSAKPKDFDNLTVEQLKSFHHENFHAGNCKIFVSGMVNDETINLINQYFGGNDWFRDIRPETVTVPEIQASTEKLVLIHKDDAMQAALRVGKRLFNKLHPDYLGMQVLNTVFGGYFGSRLMSNIREDKGYTYGINSQNVSFLKGGYLAIASNVDTNKWQEAVNEILFEMKRLREELIPAQELELVRNYMMGDMLGSFNGIFEAAGIYRRNILYGLDDTFFQNYASTVNNITAEELQRLANLYLTEVDLYIVVAGKTKS
jgi:zinc protease